MFDTNLRNTYLFLAFFILAFFPNLAHILLKPISYPFDLLSGSLVQAPTPKPATPQMSWFQKPFTLPSRSRGSYLITDTVLSELPELKSYKLGILHLFLQHTSCGLSLNENWDEDVREDMNDALDRIAPQGSGLYYRHSCEGPDDMPAHVKCSLVGASVSVPISEGRLALGTWQGIWYLEFRASQHSRKVVATIQGEKYEK
ncbi:hypothetical protein AC579_1689 [Pseudocercospora musae]|uniref:Secondary thiamine-phosphate synthase enzyme n=1 Tax=Pseudocercospora musae TaxID=113226 RepID=A0A139I4T6_9PEZI|nr:hypothetical protein AC579_1689 [Pseudocercospora musae]